MKQGKLCMISVQLMIAKKENIYPNELVLKIDHQLFIYLFIYLLTLFNVDSRIKIHSFLI